jgi:flagellar basal-body rod modification protein FlgD
MATATSATTSSLPTYQPSAASAPVGKKELDRTDFMKLFITQMQYQDPLKPLDSYEMASQLAQFSNMEATMKMSDNIGKLLQYQQSQNNLQILSLIGRNVQGFGNNLTLVDGSATETAFNISEPADSCIVTINDEKGQLISSINLGRREKGDVNFTWDGKDSRGNQVADGVYTYDVEALNYYGESISVNTMTTGKVTAVQYNNGIADVKLDNLVEIGVKDILAVK